MQEDLNVSKGLSAFKVGEKERFRGYLSVWMVLWEGLRG